MRSTSLACSAALLALAACSQEHGGAQLGVPPAGHAIPVGPLPGPNIDAGLPHSPLEATRAAEQEGRLLFLRYNCAGCHGGRAGGGMGPSLRDGSWIYGSDDGHVFASISQGRAHGMPAWGVKIPDEQVWELVAYIKSLRTDHEPDAPDQSVPEPPKP